MTLADILERDRLEARAVRLRRVVSALDHRRLYREGVLGEAPVPLRLAIADFRRELAEIERRLGAKPTA